MALILLKEYSDRHGRNHYNTLQKLHRGGFKTAVKIGMQWFIDENEEFVDNRVTSGKCRNWRRKKSEIGGEDNGENI